MPDFRTIVAPQAPTPLHPVVSSACPAGICPATRGFEVAADLYDARRPSGPDLPLPGWLRSSGSKNPVGLVNLGTETREADSPACPEEAMWGGPTPLCVPTRWTASSPGRALDIGPGPDEPPLQLRDGLAEVLPPGHEGVGRREAGWWGVVAARPEHHYFGDPVRDGPLEAEARPPY
jgi:hypothetical protein